MSANDTPAGAVKYIQKGDQVDSLLAFLAAFVVYGFLFEFLFDKTGLAILPALTIANSRPQTRRETVLAVLGSAVVAVLLASGGVLFEWVEGPLSSGEPMRDLPAWSILFFFPALLAFWIIVHLLGRKPATPGPEDELSWDDMSLRQGVALLTAGFTAAVGLAAALAPAITGPGCGISVALPMMFIMTVLAGGSTVTLAWPRAAAHRLSLLAHMGAGLVFVWLAHEAGRWVDCALEGGWLGFTGFVLSIAVYVAAVVLAAKNITRFARRHNLLRPPEWDQTDAREGVAG